MTKGIKTLEQAVDALKDRTLFTRNGRDVWVMQDYCQYPTATMVNIVTGEELGGAIGSRVLGDFVELKPVAALDTLEEP